MSKIISWSQVPFFTPYGVIGETFRKGQTYDVEPGSYVEEYNCPNYVEGVFKQNANAYNSGEFQGNTLFHFMLDNGSNVGVYVGPDGNGSACWDTDGKRIEFLIKDINKVGLDVQTIKGYELLSLGVNLIIEYHRDFTVQEVQEQYDRGMR